MIRHTFLTFLLAVIFIPVVSAFASDSKEEKIITNLGQSAISALESDSTKAERLAIFERILNDNFDMDKIARFVLGRYWKIATKDEKKEYVSLFRNMIVKVYSKRFNDYSGQKFEVNASKEIGRGDIIVNSSILSPNSKPAVAVDWRLRKGKIIDVIVEGVSMSVTQRSEFNTVIQRNGGKISALIDHLKKY